MTAAIRVARYKPTVVFTPSCDMPPEPEVDSGSWRGLQDTFNWIRLQPDLEFWSSYLAKFDRQVTRDVRTAAVGMRNGEMVMFINPDFICSHKTFEKKAGPIIHELHHGMMGHLDSSVPRGKLGNICVDLSVNSVMEPRFTEDWWLHPSQFTVDGARLATRRGWRYYWNILVDAKDFHIPEEFLRHSGVGGESVAASRSPSEGGANNDGSKEEGSGTGFGDEPGSLIHHITKDKIEKAMSGIDQGKVPWIVKKVMRIKYSSISVVWEIALKSTCRGLARSKSIRTLSKLSRRTRMPPGPQKSGVPTVLWCIDTSGSMSDDALEKGHAVLLDLAKHDGIRVLSQQFDCGLQGKMEEISRFRKPKASYYGRGGTEFKAVMDLAKKVRPNVLVIFTDGFAEGVKPPPCPVVWVYTPRHQQQLFGKHIVAYDEEKEDDGDNEW